MKVDLKKTITVMLAVIFVLAFLSGCSLFSGSGDDEEKKSDLEADREQFHKNLSLRVVEEQEGLTPQSFQELEGDALISVDYPTVESRESVTADYTSFVNGILETFHKETQDMGKPTEDTGMFTLIVTYKPYMVGNGVLGMKFTESSYSGKTSKDNYVQAFVHNMKDGERMELSDIFDDSRDYLSELSNKVRDYMLRNEIVRSNLREDLFEQGTAPIAGNFSNFVITADQKIIFFYNKGEIAPSEAGTLEACIPLSEFEGYLNEKNRELILGATVELPTDEELQPDEGREDENRKAETQIEWMQKDADEYMQPFSIEGIDIENDKVVALTFDDGPGLKTPQLLDTLRQYDAKATFFVVGEMANQRRDTLKRIYDEGHEIANHSWSHKWLTKISFEEARDEQYGKTDQVVQEVTGKKTLFARPPGGLMTEELARELDYGQVLWGNDTRDWEHTPDKDPNGVSVVYDNIMNDTSDGTIVLLHDLHDSSVEAAIRAIPDLVEKGYKLVTVSQLLQVAEARGYEINYLTGMGAKYPAGGAPPKTEETGNGEDGGDGGDEGAEDEDAA